MRVLCAPKKESSSFQRTVTAFNNEIVWSKKYADQESMFLLIPVGFTYISCTLNYQFGLKRCKTVANILTKS